MGLGGCREHGGRGAMTTEERMAPEGRRAGRGAGPALNSSACSSGRKRDSPVAVEKLGRGIAPWHIEGLFKKITMPISKEESALGCPRGDGHQCVGSHMPHGLRFCPSLSRGYSPSQPGKGKPLGGLTPRQEQSGSGGRGLALLILHYFYGRGKCTFISAL